MNTNQFFSLNRCWLLLRNDLLINYKKYLLTILGAFVVGYVYMYMKMPKEYRPIPTNFLDGQYGFGGWYYRQLFTIYLLGLGAFVGLAFPQLNHKVNVSSYLLMPASLFEKFMVQFLIRIVAGLGIFLILFWLDAHLARLSALSVFKGDSTYAIESFRFTMLGGDTSSIDKMFFAFAIFSIGIFLFSVRVFFKRLALPKTVISLAALFFIGYCLMVMFTNIYHPSTLGFRVHIDDYVITALSNKNFTIDNVQVFINSICLLSWLFFLPLGYYKLKEKQV